MAQAKRVLSTPPTNTPPTRRKILGAIAAAAAATAVAAKPAAAAGIGPTAPDPIYAAIERHKAAAVIWDAAVTIRADFPDLHMNDEQAEQCKLLDETEDAAWESCEQAGIDLIGTKPATLAGIIAAIRYVRIQMRDDGTFMPHGLEFEFDSGSEGDGGETLGWVDAFLETIASATAALALNGSEANA
jgi:hypothetical protein